MTPPDVNVNPCGAMRFAYCALRRLGEEALIDVIAGIPHFEKGGLGGICLGSSPDDEVEA